MPATKKRPRETRPRLPAGLRACVPPSRIRTRQGYESCGLGGRRLALARRPLDPGLAARRLLVADARIAVAREPGKSPAHQRTERKRDRKHGAVRELREPPRRRLR